MNCLAGDTKNIIVGSSEKNGFYYNKKALYHNTAIYRDKVQSIRDFQKKHFVLTGL